MAAEPDLIHQAAIAIASEERRERGHQVEVRVDAWASLNGRPAVRLIDPDVDLAAADRDLWHDRWMLPGPCAERHTGCMPDPVHVTLSHNPSKSRSAALGARLATGFVQYRLHVHRLHTAHQA